MEFLAGYKTKITALLVGVVTALQFGGVITPEQANSLYGVLAAFGLYSIRKAIDKV